MQRIISQAQKLEKLMRAPLLNSAFWCGVGSIATNGVNILSQIIAARIIGKEAYGQLVLLQSTTSTIGIFAGLGIGITATRYVAALKDSSPERLINILTLAEIALLVIGVFLSMIIGFQHDFIAVNILKSPEISSPLFISAFAIPIISIDNYKKSILIGLSKYRDFAYSSLLGCIPSIPIIAILAIKFGILGVAISMLVSAIIQLSISSLFCKKSIKYRAPFRFIKKSLQEWKVLRDFALPALLSSVLVTPTHWVCQTLLVHFDSNSYSDVATLGIAMQWFNIAIFLPNIIGRALLPILVKDKASRNFKASLLINILSALSVSLPIATLSSIVMSWYGRDFSNSTPLEISSFTAVIYAISIPVAQALAAQEKMWIGFIMNLGWAIAYISLSFLMVHHGATGIMFAMAIAYIMHVFWSLFAYNMLKKRTAKLAHYY
ncbi:oligosaccharide flippase family protein [Chromobacterium amazonense]|uniref:oligosaccharide flippase family protein n=1 Tax=Chromobacterium amazonense TaxID=1382803 RepID=UPI001471C39A|nr:oligosaccharide flippase family protein [Chromobacterium amazonense]